MSTSHSGFYLSRAYARAGISKVYSFLFSFGMFLMAFSTNKESGVVFPFGLPFIVLAVILAVADNRGLALERTKWVLVIIFAGFAFSPLVSSLIAPEIIPSLWRSFGYVLGFFIFLPLISRSSKLKGYSAASNYITTLTLTISLYYIVNFFVKSASYGVGRVILEREDGGLASLPWGASNVIAALIFIGLFINIQNFYRLKDNRRLFKIISISFMILAIILTFSRTIFILTVLLIIYSALRNRSFLIISFIALIFLLGYVYYNHSSPDNKFFMDRLISDRINSDSLTSFNSRNEIWATYIDYLNYNIQPIGYYAGLKMFGHSSHNVFLSTLVEQGIPALLLFLSVVSITIYNLFVRKADILLVGYFLLIVDHFFEDIQYNYQFSLIYWLFLAMTFTFPKNEVIE